MAQPTVSTTHQHEHEHGRHPTVALYFIVFAALVVGTFVTYVTAKIDLGVWNLPLALVIACTKAGLVVAFFMHLYYTRGGPLISFSVSIFWVIALILGVFGDLAFRYPLARPDNVQLIQEPPVGYNLGDGPDGHEHGKLPMGNPRAPMLPPPPPPAEAP